MAHVHGFVLRASGILTSSAGNKYQKGVMQLPANELVEWIQFSEEGMQIEEVIKDTYRDFVGKKDGNGTFIISYLKPDKKIILLEKIEVQRRYAGSDGIDGRSPIDYIMDHRTPAWVNKTLREMFGSFKK